MPVMLITGSSRGIGAATARLAGERGYDVAVNYIANKAAADAVVADIVKTGRKATAIQGDIAKPDEVAHLFGIVDREFGPLDAFVNNAGIQERAAKFTEISTERLQRLLAVNTIGAFVSAQQAVRRMSTQFGGVGGVIVNVSSLAAKLGGPNDATDYALTKGAIDTLTIGLAKEVAADGVRVNAVRPGLIYTDIHASIGVPDRVDRMKGMIPMQRGGLDREVAEVILWLCSDRSSYCTGALIDVSGGRGI